MFRAVFSVHHHELTAVYTAVKQVFAVCLLALRQQMYVAMCTVLNS